VRRPVKLERRDEVSDQRLERRDSVCVVAAFGHVRKLACVAADALDRCAARPTRKAVRVTIQLPADGPFAEIPRAVFLAAFLAIPFL
jgi:hypothetical protein